jgi:hypothetical protein
MNIAAHHAVEILKKWSASQKQTAARPALFARVRIRKRRYPILPPWALPEGQPLILAAATAAPAGDLAERAKTNAGRAPVLCRKVKNENRQLECKRKIDPTPAAD